MSSPFHALSTHISSMSSSFPALYNIRLKFNQICHTLRERLFGFEIGLVFTKYVRSSFLFLKLDCIPLSLLPLNLTTNVTHADCSSGTFCHYKSVIILSLKGERNHMHEYACTNKMYVGVQCALQGLFASSPLIEAFLFFPNSEQFPSALAFSNHEIQVLG